MFVIFFQILNKRKAELNTWIDEIKSNNPNADVSELTVQKLSENSYLLDDLIMSKLPNGDPMPDSMIEEELHLLAFTVSSLLSPNKISCIFIAKEVTYKVDPSFRVTTPQQ